MSPCPPIHVEGVSVRFGRRTILEDVSLGVQAGTTTVLLGPNGVGKSTLLRVCLGVVSRFSGDVLVAGRDPARRSHAVRRIVGYMPDEPDVYPWMTARDLFAFLAPHYGTWDASEVGRQVERLEVPLDVSFERMSRGQGMKAMLVAALAHRPPVLLLDEPFGGLDPLIREEVLRNVIGALAEDDARAVLIATHDLEVAARVADRVAVLAHGRLRQEGPVEELGIAPEPTPAAKRLHRALAVAAADGADEEVR